MTNISVHPQTGGTWQRFWLGIVVALIFAVGIGVRLYDLTDLPLDFHPTRQLHSALIARGMYYQNLETAPDWQRELAVRQWKAEGLIEPQILESLTALTYRLAGGDYLWIPRLYSILFWTLGGVALLLLALDLAGGMGAVIALMFYFLSPYAVQASRAFMPDPMMVMLMIFSFWAATRWLRSMNNNGRGSWGWAVAAGILTGIAMLTKSVAGFFLLFIWMGLVLTGPGLKRAIKSTQVWVIVFLAVLPSIVYYLYGTLVVHLLQGQFSLRFFPQLWKDPAFYLRWLGEVKGVIGFGWLLTALLGSLVVRNRTLRAGLLGWWIGYVIYGMVFAYHISTHDYYTLPLVPAAALGIGSAGEALLARMRSSSRWLQAAAALVLLAGIVFPAYDARTTLKKADYRSEATAWKRIGSQFAPEDGVVGLTSNYGASLEYWGWRSITVWQYAADVSMRELAGQTIDFKSEFTNKTAGNDYFLITNFGELDKQPALKEILAQNYPLIRQEADFWIYDLQHPLNP